MTSLRTPTIYKCKPTHSFNKNKKKKMLIHKVCNQHRAKAPFGVVRTVTAALGCTASIMSERFMVDMKWCKQTSKS